MSILIVTLLSWCLLCPSLIRSAAAQDFELKYAPAPVDNPLKGLVPYADPHPDRFPHSLEFNYLGLGELVVGPQQYNFKPLEELLNRVAARGNQTVFRIMIEYPGKQGLIPKYLVDGGLKVHRYMNTNTAPFPPQAVETPDYEDRNLRSAIKDFIRELGRRYDGDSRIGFITAGLLGTWGEWHTYPRSELWASKEVQTEVLDAYARDFTKTPVLLRYPAGDDNAMYAKTVGRPFGYHDDSFAFATLLTARPEDNWYFQALLRTAQAEECWKKYPIGGEVRPEVWACCFDAKPCTPDGQSFAACRDAMHVTWLMETGMFQEKSKAERYERAIEQVRKLGYEFQVTRARLSRDPANHEVIELQLSVKNTGIAPFYHDGWAIELAMLDTDGKILRRWPTPWSLRNNLPSEAPKHWPIQLKREQLIAGNVLALRVVNPLKGGKLLRFANESQDRHATGWLSLLSLPRDF